MIRFLFKGILGDRSRSLLPIIVVSLGVMLIVTLHCWLKGVIGESLVMNANFLTGHTRVMTRAYAAESDQIPNDLAILGADSLITELNEDFPAMDWVPRIRFGAIIDFPDSSGETRAQGPVAGWAIDLLKEKSREPSRFNIRQSLVSGRVPAAAGEALITNDFAEKFKVNPGDEFTLFGSTMEGSMAFKNFVVAGTVRFGSAALDRGAILIDIEDARSAFSMEDAAGEILGFSEGYHYREDEAARVTSSFNNKHAGSDDEFAPVMLKLSEQGGMAEYMEYSNNVAGIMIFVFVLAMSVVLWNTGLLGGLRRYNEFGVRLALGEEKNHIYTSLLAEAVLIGIVGSVIGTLAGLSISYYLQEVGIDVGSSMKGSSLMMPSVVRAVITPRAFVIGFIPGIISVLLGNALAGLGIYKRKTAQLFKELE